MKKALFTIGTTLTLLFASASLNAQNGGGNGNDNQLTAKARHAAADCIKAYSNQGYDIVSGVETTGICFVSGELHKVTFWAKVKCNSEICPQVMAALVATVYFDCEDNVSNVECGLSTQ